ncbi:MAG: RHS repeat-associated core domain-containing protein, partial [Bacteroidales bacterium]|nr:RHS repeat-associated core domain-containing protein [Bacteroidales bacterium]
LQSTDYYPFGTPFSTNNLNNNRYLYNGKEYQNQALSSTVFEAYDYGARFYDSRIGRWTVVDPMAEKYYGVNPYVYGLNNPVRFIDPDGREIRVAGEYQDQFLDDLRNIFGNRANMFAFNELGKLLLDERVKEFTRGMNKDQKEAFKGLNKAMSDKQVTSVVYANTYDLTIDGQTRSVDVVGTGPEGFGGGLYSKTDNLIVVAPNVGTVTVELDVLQFANGTVGFPKQDVQQNTTSTLFHEIGERNTKNINFRGAVLDYENHARRVIGLPMRPYDLNHSKIIRTDYKK